MAELKDLSPDQQKVVETWGEGLAVLAGAGSGKTTTLVIKCAELLKRKGDARFAAVSFTERSASDLKAKLSARLPLQGNGSALSGHWVMTIHGLCGAILREFPREAGFDGEESVLSESESRLLWERALESLWFGDLPEDVEKGVALLLSRESRDGLIGLVSRLKDLAAFGAIDTLIQSEGASSQALGAVGRFVLEKYDRLKKRRGAIDFGDLELGADRALEVPAVREAFHRRFDLVLVDEFQDTNPLQARIILKFVRPDASNLCVVGDPKQSIYRFRDADVTVFEDFCNRLPKQQSLSWNFRSRPGIIHYTNHICARAFEASSMKYEPLEPKRDAGEKGEPVVRLDLQDPAELGAWIQAENDRGVPLHEMALLVRRIRGNEKWFKALSAAGIPLAMGSGGLFWEDPRVRELVAFLKWWDNPANALSGGVFLRAPWVGVSDVELDSWIQKDPTWLAPFFASEHPLAQVLKPLRGRVVRPGELLMELAISPEIEAEIGSALLGLWHRVEEFSAANLDFHGVVLEISRAVEERRRERDVPPPKNQGQLPVLTFHSSKGLEFDHVILIDLGKKPRAGASPLLFWDREKGAYLTPRNEEGERDDEDPELAGWKALEKERNLAESKRIFYVALTRAKERLILVCPELPAKQQEKGFDRDKVFHEEDWRGWIECAGVELPAAKDAVGEPSGEASAAESANLLEALPRRPEPGLQKFPGLIRPRHSVTEWNLLARCPRAYEWKFIRPRAVLDVPVSSETLASSDSAGISFQELGTAVHGALERGDFAELAAIERKYGEKYFRAEPVIAWAENSPWMKREGHLRVWTELAFEVPVGREILVGSMDRLIQESERVFRLVDFKVSPRHKKPEELIENYRTQLDLYARAIHGLIPASESNPPQVEATLVSISPEGVVEVPVPLTLDSARNAEALASLAAKIVEGEPGKPAPGLLCRYCEWKSVCPDSSVSRSR